MLKFWLGIALTLFFAPILTSSAANDTSLQFSSGENRVALIELFTSEGCSSCPPADRWLSKLKNDRGLWRDYVPIAFHVDYWDYIGWQDPFASNENSDRQRRYAREGGARFVYTPGFFNNGQEWVGWRDRESVEVDKTIAGNLSVLVDGDTIAVHFDNPGRSNDNLRVHVAVLGMGLTTKVRAGENKGRLLKHDFVALDVVSAPLTYSAGGFKAVTRLSSANENDVDKALVVWVSSDDVQTPLQAVGGLLPGV